MGIYVLLRFGFIAPIPSSVVAIYMGIVSLAILAYVSSSQERREEVSRPLVRFMTEKRYTPLLAATVVALPVLAAANVYVQMNAPLQPPSSRGRCILHRLPRSPFTTRRSILTPATTPSDISRSRIRQEFRKHVENGRQVYYRNCVFCHGDNMSANGMFVHGLDPIPTNFHDTIPLLRETFLFWRISKGGPGLPDEGGPWDTAMPAWEKFLKEDEMWDAILFLYDFTGRGLARRRRPERNDLLSGPSRARLVLPIASLCAAPMGSARAAAQDVGTEAQRESGKKLYLKYCSQCHGEKGDGEGYAAPHLRPRPRNFTTGKFKVRTTPNGALPTHQDLVNVIRRGMPYTSMPAWPSLSDQEVSDLAYFITTFSPDFSNKENVPAGAAPECAERHERVHRAREEALRGDRMREVPRYAWSGRRTFGSHPDRRLGHPIRPADLAQSWTFRGGSSREDIFRTMSTGLNGTPMASFAESLTPEQRWAITDFIVSLSGSDGPGYANLVVAKHVQDPMDLAKGAANFASAPVARFPIVGQIWSRDARSIRPRPASPFRRFTMRTPSPCWFGGTT